MNKTMKILLLLTFFVLIFSVCVFAEEATEEPNTDNPESQTIAEPIDEDATAPEITSSVPSNNSTDFFTSENVLAIIVITVGLVLIFLGVAIFIRLR